ncbi:MAG: aminotransferase class IV [Acidaminococcales bacterium]|jgi:D-alanine transaminase|nr:aminotransferase class IV [Acidaminococcales bacterium]
MNTVAMLNGQFVDINQPLIHIEDRGYQFGDGVYEVVPVMDGRMAGFEYHMERLDRSLRELKIPAVYTHEDFYEFFVAMIEKGEIYDGNIYLQITRGVSQRQHQFPEQTVPVMTMVGRQRSYEKINQQYIGGVTLLSMPDIRWHRCDIKTINLLPNALAKQKALESGFDDALFYREESGNITECSSSNFYAVKNGVVWTHPDGELILPGCTKRIIIHDLCGKIDVPVVEKAFNLDFAKTADETFMSAASYCGMPVVKIDKTPIGTGKPGPVAQKIQAEFKKYLSAQKIVFAPK